MEERMLIQVKMEMHTNGGDEGDERKQVDRDQQGGDQAVPVHHKNYEK